MNKQYFLSLVIILLLTGSSCFSITPTLDTQQTLLYNLFERNDIDQQSHPVITSLQSISPLIKHGDQKAIELFLEVCNVFATENGTPISLADIQPYHLRALGKKITACNAYMSKKQTAANANLFHAIAQCNESILLCLQDAVSQHCGFIDHAIDSCVYRPIEFVSEHKVLTACALTLLVAGIACYCLYPSNNNNNNNNTNGNLNNNNLLQPLDGRGVRGITLAQGDITRLHFQDPNHAAIVNAANTAMRGGAGIDFAIHQAAGPGLLQEEQNRNLNCPIGQARITGGHNLGPRRIIHTVGPDTRIAGQNEQKATLLNNAYQNSLNLAVDNGITQIALPSISTGIYRYPIAEAALIAVNAAIRQQQGDDPLAEIRFVTFDQNSFEAYRRVFELCNLRR